MHRIFEVGKHPLQKHCFLVRLLADGRGLCRWVDDAFRFLDCFVLAAFLVVHYEVDYINGLAVGIAVGGEAIGRLGFVVQLQARGFVVVERAL
jgi:hypothetical protein